MVLRSFSRISATNKKYIAANQTQNITIFLIKITKLVRGIGIKQQAHAKTYVSDAACLIREDQAALQLHRSGVGSIGIDEELGTTFLGKVRNR